MSIHPFHLVLSALAHWANKEQAAIIDYLREENRVLRDRLGPGKLRFTDAERRRLAAKAKLVCRRVLREIGSLVTPDTPLRWHRQLVARKYDGSQRITGRPPVPAEIAKRVVRMAKENPSWGYTWIRGALLKIGHEVGRNTIARILEDHGIEPAPRRRGRMSWKTFLQAHWDVIAASDMFTVELWLGRSLVRYHVLFAIELATRRVNIMGIAPEPEGRWMAQVARNATDAFDGFLTCKRYLIIDLDSRFTKEFRGILLTAGVNVIRTPPRSPNLNAFAERFVHSIKEECLGRMIFFSEKQLRIAVSEYVEHYHRERNHQGLGNRLIVPAAEATSGTGKVVWESRLGGLLNHYRRAA
jgi:transposase InsO family protein